MSEEISQRYRRFRGTEIYNYKEQTGDHSRVELCLKGQCVLGVGTVYDITLNWITLDWDSLKYN